MATKAEQFQSDAQRTLGKSRKKSHVSQRKPKKAAWSHDKQHAASKATHALEDAAPGERRSRVDPRELEPSKARRAIQPHRSNQEGIAYEPGAPVPREGR